MEFVGAKRLKKMTRVELPFFFQTFLAVRLKLKQKKTMHNLEYSELALSRLLARDQENRS